MQYPTSLWNACIRVYLHAAQSELVLERMSKAQGSYTILIMALSETHNHIAEKFDCQQFTMVPSENEVGLIYKQLLG